ncbi:PREDICTED: dnaJ homolog subfamily C member 24-like [Branchiostoma belcheri]|uniref:DnaJ homolog subfamily C member 24-like n=1 Tax=Branchiostoma belcheri TaxID=7741 RepID=A0A6P4ZDE3_BRABE|nr:PREDICTED: dnaJ homolog subfamily C member 24-like [Branchiostoma belcheri]
MGAEFTGQIPDLYCLLQVPKGASYEELKQSYQRLVLKYHPDKIDRHQSPEDQAAAQDMFVAVDKAWKTLGDPTLRKEYDARLNEKTVSQEFPVDEEITLADMDYDEDEGVYSYPCRCGDDYSVCEDEVGDGRDMVICCSTCSLTVRVQCVSSMNEQDDTHHQEESR